MGDKAERDTAYFALLRAQDELRELLRHEQHLGEELRRLRRADREESALRAAASERMRRVLRESDVELRDVTARRSALIEDELARLPARIAAAEEFVRECEHHHDVLRGR